MDGSAVRITEIVLVGEGGGFPFEADCGSITFVKVIHGIALAWCVTLVCGSGLVPAEFGAGRKGAFL